MKVVILAGGLGTRLSEETDTKPKPMVEIGGMPILWHIMKMYAYHGFTEFILCAGYKAYCVKDFFYHYFMHASDMTIDMRCNKVDYHMTAAEPWKVTIVDTGLMTMTGGRLSRIREYVGEEPFMLTYGDGLADVDIGALLEEHRRSKRLATLTAVLPTGKFGALNVASDGGITSFLEKPRGDGSWISGGFFVLEPGVFDYIPAGDAVVWERDPLERLAEDGQLHAYRHAGFWKPMDTMRDRIELERIWEQGNAPWKVWRD